MNVPDLVTAGFEIGAAVMCAKNVAQLAHDKEVRGVAISVTAFFAAWGVWNLWFFGFVGMPLAQASAGFVALANAAWVGLALHFKRRGNANAELR